MASIKINVKWNKDVLKDVEVDTSLPPTVLKAQLFSLTNVPTERQKIMVKGQTIGDDTWGKVTLTNGLTLLMMGSADPVPQLPTEKVKFIEDMTEAQLAQHLQYPGGLKNLDVKYLLTGLKNRLEEQITKHSSTLDCDAIFTKSTRLSRLPAYLTIQFVRFFYKEKEKVNAKILKDVQYSMILDLFDICTPDLQKRFMPTREKIKLAEDAKLDRERAKKLGETVIEPKNLTRLSTSFPDDIGSNNSGFYQLNAVLTHKGRSSSSGHYVAWVRRSQTEWLMFDDENVTPVTEEDVLKLSGGGDWHTAYLLIYGPRTIEYEDKTNEGASGESTVTAMDTTASSNGART
ncbi:unnamed protein product [Rotaria magnacalcarata]|uniref:Ubiquitin carboxyl-terminal hydrolase 14 n=1 Tax=Rotaria magnacalcarata TaxID=392030 RepID=A0A819SM52_9BILA|nr:unnamed protein product [Rotaria magnacalcarata]